MENGGNRLAGMGTDNLLVITGEQKLVPVLPAENLMHTLRWDGGCVYSGHPCVEPDGLSIWSVKQKGFAMGWRS